MRKKNLNEFEQDYIKETQDLPEWLINSNLNFDTMSLARILHEVRENMTY